MKTYIVQLEDHDDILSARDKISWSKARRVLLVWPRKGRVLERRVDLLLLMRHCEQLGFQMAVVTRSGEVRAQAGDLGIPVFSSPAKAQAVNWRRGRAGRRSLRQLRLLAQPPAAKPQDEDSDLDLDLEPESEDPSPPRSLREQRFDLLSQSGPELFPLKNIFLRLGVFSAGVLALLALSFFFTPGARVVLEPERSAQALTIPVWASPEINTANPSGGLPALTASVIVEGREAAASTSQVRLPDAAAAGTVVLTNLTDRPVEVPAGTVVLAPAVPPVRFFTTRKVTVAAGPGQTASAPVRAALPGSGGNVAAGAIQAVEGSLGLRLTAQNPQGTKGGLDRMSPAPSAGDYRQLRAKLLEKLRLIALEEMRAQLDEGQRLLEISLQEGQVFEEVQDPPAGQPGDQLQLTLRVEFTAWYVRESDLLAVSQAVLDANTPAQFQPVPDSLRFSFTGDPALESSSGGGPERVRWSIRVDRTLQAAWSEESVVSAVLGREVRQAQAELEGRLKLSSPPVVQLFPSWWPRMPFLPFRIEVVQQ